MAKITWKGGTLLSPVPAVLVSCGTIEKPTALTVAWTGIINSDPPKTYISVRPERNSYDIIKSTGEFVINMLPSSLVKTLDYCGIKSGKHEDKLEKRKLTALLCEKLSAPLIAQSKISLECKVIEVKPLGSHDMFIADIVSVDIDEDLIDEKGRLMIEQAGLMAYAHGTYFALGKKIGTFGFSCKTKRVKDVHMKNPQKKKKNKDKTNKKK
ncbi:MAG: flavin reductase family protein [Oscillospiraceae bacterium]|nr:flavin reductase family protein [Oscillospiraceae bacterium]